MPVEDFIKVSKVYLLDKTETQLGINDLDTIFNVTGGVFLRT